MSLFKYLSMKKHPDATITLNEQQLNTIWEGFRENNPGVDIDDDEAFAYAVETYRESLGLNNNTENFECLALIVKQDTVEDAKTEIIDKFQESEKFDEIQSTVEEPKKKKSKAQPKKQVKETQVIDEVICLILKKRQAPAIDNFIETFLFQRVKKIEQAADEQVMKSLGDDREAHPLIPGTMLDLFIRHQMMERGTVTSAHPRKRFRLVEPISLTDEFESWTFDHFRELLDLWLIIDMNSKENFPLEWKLSPTAKIRYAITDGLNTTDDDQGVKHLERPSTKSLENFIRDICEIEENGMFKEWFIILTEKENIQNYSHLTNLNQKEWDGIKNLPMNAVKTIKFYVDREKQSIEGHKKKAKKDESAKKHSESELRANLHMIKLFILSQLQHHDEIEMIPKLDAFCVKEAFKEMREDYEDDGLFDEMQLFFQPLTVSDEDLEIKSTVFDQFRNNQERRKKTLQRRIGSLQTQEDDLNKLLNDQKEVMETSKTQQLSLYSEYENKRKQLDHDLHEEIGRLMEPQKNQLETLLMNINACQEKIRSTQDAANVTQTQMSSADLEAEKKTLKELQDQYRQMNATNEKQTVTLKKQFFKKRNDLDKEWAQQNGDLMNKIDEYQEKIRGLEVDLLSIQNKKAEKAKLLEIVNKDLDVKTRKIDKKLVKHHRGFIMYGPPGTGKSVIMSSLAKKVGIAMLGPPLAAGELERPLVGQSEAVILDLCMRGNRLPHLICCVSIDEIDSLAPRRDEDSSEGKVAKISVLLSVIEGIKDVPNLMFFSATNRLHMMDEAFLRRMSGKFFVGRPSAKARQRILQNVPTSILQENIRKKLSTATTNFSGAALKALTSAITVHYLAKRRDDNPNYEISEEDTLRLADRTARQFQLLLGVDTLPRLLLDNLKERKRAAGEQTVHADDSAGFHLPEKRFFTGKIIISLNEKKVRIEAAYRNGDRYVIEDPLNSTERSLQQLLDRITSYGNDCNVQLLQLIDLNLLSSKGAHDEKKIFETLKERYDECMEYKSSMIIYDLDSLIGVNKSESESSMGTSVSSSVVNQNIYIYVTSRFREAKIEINEENDEQAKIQRWAIAVVRDPFLLKKFIADVDFTKTKKQRKEEEAEEQRANTILVCVKCRDLYIESENKMGSCNHHDGFVYDNLEPDLRKYRASEAMETLSREEYIAFKDSTRKDEIERMKTRFKYICCNAVVQVGGGTTGCKKAKHGFEGSSGSKSTSQTLSPEMISEWESFCDIDEQYNQIRMTLLDHRLNV